MSHVAFQLVGKIQILWGSMQKFRERERWVLRKKGKRHKGESNPNGWPWRLIQSCFTIKAKHDVVSFSSHIFYSTFVRLFFFLNKFFYNRGVGWHVPPPNCLRPWCHGPCVWHIKGILCPYVLDSIMSILLLVLPFSAQVNEINVTFFFCCFFRHHVSLGSSSS